MGNKHTRLGLLGIMLMLMFGISVTHHEIANSAASAIESAHPRLFFDEQALPMLRSRASATHESIWEPILEYVVSLLGTSPPPSAPSTGDEDTYRNYGNQLIPMSFVCAVTGETRYCELAKTYLLTYASWDQWGNDHSRDLGLAHMLMGNALAYDWLYPELTSEERQLVASSLAAWAQKMYEASSGVILDSWNNWWNKAYIQNHYWINNSALGMAGLALLNDRTEVPLTCSITASGNVNLRRGPGLEYTTVSALPAGQQTRMFAQGTVGADGYVWWQLVNTYWVRSDVVSRPGDCTNESVDTLARTWLNQAVDRLSRLSDLLATISDSSWHEGIGYQTYGLTLTLPFLSNLRRLTGINLLPYSYLAGYPYWRLYNDLPGSVESILSYGDFEVEWGNIFAGQNVLRFVAEEYRDGYAEWMAQRLIDAGGRSADVWHVPWYVFEFLYYDPTVVSQPPTALTGARVFPDLQGVIWRTGWAYDDLVFGLKTGAYGGNAAFETFTQELYPWELPCEISGCQYSFGHDHDDANTIYLYRAGQWLIPENVGVGKQATMNHNTLLIDGQGQYRPPGNQFDRYPQDLAGSNGFLEATASTPHFDYLAADATQRYRQIADLEDTTRFVVFVRPDYWVMLDALSAEQEHQYEWVMHFGNEAAIDEHWIRGVSGDDQIVGVQVLAPADFEGSTGQDEYPYVRIQPAQPAASTQFLMLLYPTNAANWSERPTASVLGQTGDAVAIRVQGDGRRDDVLMSYAQSTASTQVGPYEFDGRAAVLVRGSDGGLEKLFIYGATFLAEQDSERRLLVGSLDPEAALEIVYGGETMTVFGQITAGASLYAPEVENVIVNGADRDFSRSGSYITLGE
jgi:hypothetical protein